MGEEGGFARQDLLVDMDLLIPTVLDENVGGSFAQHFLIIPNSLIHFDHVLKDRLSLSGYGIHVSGDCQNSRSLLALPQQAKVLEVNIAIDVQLLGLDDGGKRKHLVFEGSEGGGRLVLLFLSGG